MSSVKLTGVSKTYGKTKALLPLDLEIREGEFLSLLGPSGCGKTTTLRIVAGFVNPTTGNVFINDSDVTQISPQKRNIGMVFQDYALFPHMTVAENIGFGLRERKVSRVQENARVRELLELIQLPHIADRYTAEISGGQAQRVALARAVAHTPDVLLLDEPLGALDLKMREAMQHEVRRIQQELSITTLYVTHDQTEAFSMSDRIVVMHNGAMAQIGTAREIYDTPVTRFVAGFVGQINLIDGAVTEAKGEETTVTIAGHTFIGRAAARFPRGTPVSMAVRPEAISLYPKGDTGADVAGRMNRIDVTVRSVEFAGNIAVATVTAGGLMLSVEIRPHEQSIESGQHMTAIWQSDMTRFLAE
jgi:spermidine/putrescine ABC transporter ATP-binding subunit